MRLLYIIKRPLTKRDAERYGIMHAIARGHSVDVFDLTRVIHPELPAGEVQPWQHPDIRIEAFEDWPAFVRRERELANVDLVMLLIQSYGLSRAVLPVLRLIARARTPYLIFTAPRYADGLRFEDIPATRKLHEAWSRLKLMDPVNSIVARMRPSWLGLPAARFAVVHGLASATSSNLICDGTRLIPAHTHDYDLFLRAAAEDHAVDNSAVFIDQYAPFHSDTRVLKTVTRIDPDSYYRALRGFFDRIEDELDLKVVVAAHPRADYAGRSHLFGDRKIVYERTPQTIARSRLVLSHVSTAVGFAVLFKRPVMMVTTQDYYRLTPGHGLAFEKLAANLGTALHFIDEPAQVDLASAMRVDDASYNRYISRYLRHPDAPEGYLWNIVLDTVERAAPFRH
jgi:hypothetical protein